MLKACLSHTESAKDKLSLADVIVILNDHSTTVQSKHVKRSLEKAIVILERKNNYDNSKLGPLELRYISSDKTESNLADERKKSSVIYKGKTYLPLGSNDSVILPSFFLRSPLFMASKPTEASDGRYLQVVGSNSSLLHTGPELGVYDRKVLAACCDYYHSIPVAGPH